jgi:8-oxo-dGTP diphosphatase
VPSVELFKPSVHVVAGAIFDAAGRVLIAQRPQGVHMAGGWEFPGGKLQPGEERFAGLKRELLEELGIDVVRAEPLIAYEHTYPTRVVYLDFWRVLEYSGTPQSLEDQPLRWVRLDELSTVGILEADEPMIAALTKTAV